MPYPTLSKRDLGKMLRLLSTSSCVWSEPVKSLANSALESGQRYILELVLSSSSETEKIRKLGLGLPILAREDGAFSKDAINWVGVPKRKKGKDVSQDEQGISE